MAVASSFPVCSRPPSFGGFHAQVAVCGPFEYPGGRLDLGLGRLQDHVLAGIGPVGERGAEVFEGRIFGRQQLAVPFG